MKRGFLDNCSFTQLFHDVEQLRRKQKRFVNDKQRIWYVQHIELIFEKFHLGEIFQCRKNLRMLRFSRFWDKFLYNHHFTHIAASVCPSARQPLSNPRSTLFSSPKHNNNILFLLRVWQKSPKIILYRNWNCSSSKTGTHVIKVLWYG